MCSKTMKQWSRWSLKEEALQWDMFPGLTELHLIGCLIELILDTQIQIKYIDIKSPTRWHFDQRTFHTRWVESFVVLVQYEPFQFDSLLWYNGEAISTRFRRRTSHSKIETYDESHCEDSIVRVVFNISEPGEEMLRNLDPWKSVDGEDRSGDLVKKQIYSRASLQQIIQNWITTVLGLLKRGKLRLRRTIDQGNLIKLFGEWHNKFDLITKNFFSTEPRNP